jgi:hypothetical protein
LSRFLHISISETERARGGSSASPLAGRDAMSRVVVLGAGISGHTAASFLRKWLPRGDDVIVISPKADYNWIPSNIWVGVGLM